MIPCVSGRPPLRLAVGPCAGRSDGVEEFRGVCLLEDEVLGGNGELDHLAVDLDHVVKAGVVAG